MGKTILENWGGKRNLTEDKMSSLGEAIREAETVGIPRKPSLSKYSPKRPENQVTKIDPCVAAAIRLLILTGCRLREILNLRWAEADIERGLLFLPDSKTGRKTVVLSAAAQPI